MPGENLTRVEAADRAAIISVDSYQVHLDLTNSDRTFRSITTVKFSAKAGASSFIDAITDKVHSVTLNGEKLNNVSDGVRIQLPNLAEENTLVVDADALYMHTGEGLHRFVDPADGEVYLYTQFEVPDSRRMFAVFEQPDLKATFQFTVKAPSHWQVVSNQPTPKPLAIDDKVSVWEFEPTLRMSSYITALIAGPYVSRHSELTSADGRTIPLGVYCRKSLEQYLEADYMFDKTREGFKFFEETFKYPYPFSKYDQLYVPDFNAGAMENAGAVTFTESYVFRGAVAEALAERRVTTILHELAHMWFGDLVTMRWWNDLWLNESFAEYASHLAMAEATEWTEAWTTFATGEKSWAYTQDQMPTTHPIVAEIRDLEDVQVNFDGITYAKGASVLKQLAAYVGREPFINGVAAYFKKHEFGNAVLNDLLVELEKTSGRDLKAWSAQWLETAGVNTLRAHIEEDGQGNISSFKIEQTADAKWPTIRDHRMVIGFYDLVDGKLSRVHRLELDVTGTMTEVTELVGIKRPSLVLLNDEDLAYAKIRLDEKSWQFALENLDKFEDSLARALVWGAAWDATRDGEVNPRDFVRLVLGNVEAETQGTALQTVLRQLLTTVKIYVSPANRASLLAEVGEALLAIAHRADAGSDLQLLSVKFAALFAASQKVVAELRELLDGKSLPGLTVDQDLRWELLNGLVMAGAAGQSEIDAELQRDNTANGQKQAILAEGSIPTLEAKAKAWTKVTEDAELSNTLINFGSLGVTRAFDPSLLEPNVAKYFDVALQLWESRTFKIAEYLLENLYPWPLANEALAAETRKFLEREEVKAKPAMHRIIVENLAIVERALKAQKMDK